MTPPLTVRELPGGIAQAVMDAATFCMPGSRGGQGADIAGATHLLPMEAPRPVAAAIAAFL